jgi:transposase-like protein
MTLPPDPHYRHRFDEVFIRIQGVQHYLWRAVDQHGVVLDIPVQARRDAQAAKRFFKRLLKGLQYACAYREIRSNAFNVWQEETCARSA